MCGEVMKKLVYDCPFCEEEHEVSVVQYKTRGMVKNVEVEYMKSVYYCDREKEEFTPAMVMDDNLYEAREAYRKANSLLQVEEIKAIRETYGVTQKEYSRLLGVGEATIQRYETKQIQDSTYDMIMRMTGENPGYCLVLLEKNKNEFALERYQAIREKILERIKKIGDNYLVEEIVRAKYAEYYQPSEENGFCVLDIARVRNILAYLAEKVENFYKVKAMKLLWYIDEVSFMQHGKAMTGLVYQHKPYGALPVAHNELIRLKGLSVTEEEKDDYVAYRIASTMDFEEVKEQFSQREMTVLDTVINKFSNYSTKEIVSYMHEEIAYKITNDNEIIPFSSRTFIRDL